jgi:hypothetical protein
MGHIKLKNLLKKNMRRFKTKNLSETGRGVLQTATPNKDSGWESMFNDFASFMGDQNSKSNQIFGWWLEVYAAMGEQLAFYAEQLKEGRPINEFQQDILKIADASITCIKKFQTTTSDLWNAFQDDGYDYIVDDIKDDLVGELKDLIKTSSKFKPYKLGERLAELADDYQTMSEQLLEFSWDYATDSEADDNSDNVNVYSQN